MNVYKYPLHLIILSFFSITWFNHSIAQEMMDGPIIICPAGDKDHAGHEHIIRQLIKNRQKKEPTAIFEVTYNGFTTEARNAFQFAVDIWAGELVSSVPIQIDANFTSLGSNILGSAGAVRVFANFDNVPLANTWYPSALANSLAGEDLDDNSPDINANFSNDFNFYFGTDGNCPVGKFDFVTVVLHELGHGLGFFSSTEMTGNSGTFGQSNNNVLYPYIFDAFIQNASNQKMTTISNPSTQLGSFLVSNNLFFGGTEAQKNNLNAFPKIYAPDPFDSGSSISHWNDATFTSGTENALMTAQLAPREVLHDIGNITRGLMQDIGWQLNPNLNVVITNYQLERTTLNDVTLSWKTVVEKDNQSFEVFKSPDNVTFQSIGVVSPRNQGFQPESYTFTDPFAWDVAYYYLKQTNVDDSFENLDTLLAPESQNKQGLAVFPNPSTEAVYINLGEGRSLDEMIEVAVFDRVGKQMMTAEVQMKDIQTPINQLFKNIPPGLYTIKVKYSQGTETAKFIKH
jgi:hypothetical protein